jgi:hypothetical protein
LSGRDNLRVAARIKGVDEQRIPEALDIVGLAPRQKDAFSKYSLGMKQRLALAATMLGDPELIILDEPANGLDPEGMREVREIILALAARGATIFLSSHLLWEVERTCTHVAILRTGKVVRQSAVRELVAGATVASVASNDLEALRRTVAEYPGATSFEERGDRLFVHLTNDDLAALNRFAHERGRQHLAPGGRATDAGGRVHRGDRAGCRRCRMKIGALLRIEYIKTVRRRAFWVAIAFLTLISGMVVISGFRAGQRGMGAPFVPPFSWAMTAAQLSLIPTVFLALTIVMLVTSEYSWRTARQNVIDGLSKEQFFVAKWLMAMTVAIVFIMLPFVFATGTVIYGRVMGATPRTATTPASTTATSDRDARDATLRAFNDSTRKALAAAPTAADSARIITRRRSDSTQAALQQALRDVRAQRPRGVFPAPDPSAPLVSLGDIKVAGGYALGAMGFAAMAFMLAMLLRSTGGAVGLFFLYLAFLEQLIGLMLRQFGSAELASKVMPYMPVSALRAPMNPDVWHAAYVERQNAIAASIGQPALVVNADMLKLIGLLRFGLRSFWV